MLESTLEAYTLAKIKLKSHSLKMVRKRKLNRLKKLFDLKKLLQNTFSQCK